MNSFSKNDGQVTCLQVSETEETYSLTTSRWQKLGADERIIYLIIRVSVVNIFSSNKLIQSLEHVVAII